MTRKKPSTPLATKAGRQSNHTVGLSETYDTAPDEWLEEGVQSTTPLDDDSIIRRNKRIIGITALLSSILLIIAGVLCIMLLTKDATPPEESSSAMENIDNEVGVDLLPEKDIIESTDIALDAADVPTPSPIDISNQVDIDSEPWFAAYDDDSTVSSNSTQSAEEPATDMPSLPPQTSRPTDEPSSSPTKAKPILPPNWLKTFPPTTKPSLAPTSSAPATSTPTTSPSQEEVEIVTYDAVIVGAGWSGLRAAQILSDAGASVLVLDANDYIGGRARQLMNNDDLPPTDLGCEWLYTDNTMLSELKNSGLIDYSIENDPMDTIQLDSELYYSQTINADGSVGLAEVLDDVDKLQSSLWGDFMSFVKDILKGGDISYADALDQFFEGNDDYANEDEQLLNLVLDMGETEYAGETTDISMAETPFWFMEGCSFEAYYLSVPNVGFGNTAVSFANRIKANIKLNSKVVGINYEDDSVLVTYNDESGTAKKVETRAALITASLGALKAKTITFTPPLPDSKQDAIDNMGFGLLNKAVLYWDSNDAIVWPDTYWFELVTPDDASSGLWTTWYNPSKLKGRPCLVGWIGGDEAVDMEEWSDEDALDQVMRNLRSMFPAISQPDHVFFTRWGKEEHVRGSYSFNKVGRKFATDAANLKETIDNKVWFAGEATNLDEWHATTVGAWETGEEAAGDMLSTVLKRKKRF